jgi:hypothetical protein
MEAYQMRLAPKQVQNRLDWSVLDVEQEEWDKCIAGLNNAASDELRLSQAAEHVEMRIPEDSCHPDALRFRTPGHLVLICAAVGVMVTLLTCALWRTAQLQILRVQGEVANAVKLDAIAAHAHEPRASNRESLTSVEFVEGTAVADVLVTKTMASGAVNVYPEVRFYVSTAKGWQRTAPIDTFWGLRATVETANLQFLFGEKDRSLVQQVAPDADALYATLRRATGQGLGEGNLLTVEIVPGPVACNAVDGFGRVRMCSPLLYHVPPEQRGQLFIQLLRQVLADALVDVVLKRTPVKEQWHPMLDGFRNLLWLGAIVQPVAPGAIDGLPERQRSQVVPMSLDDLLDAETRSHSPVYRPDEQYYEEERAAAAAQLMNFITITYGIDVIPKVLQGFAEYQDWETLAPAVLGVTAADLEAAWHANWR